MVMKRKKSLRKVGSSLRDVTAVVLILGKVVSKKFEALVSY